MPAYNPGPFRIRQRSPSGATVSTSPVRTSYQMGLSHFPDSPRHPGLGLSLTDIVGGIGDLVTGNVGGALQSLAAGVGVGTGSDKNPADWQARESFFQSYAQNGNIAAWQIMLGGSGVGPNHPGSGTEEQMYVTGLQQLSSLPNAAAWQQQAMAAGPVWSNEPANNYPQMKAAVANWAAQHPVTTTSSVLSSSVAGVPTWLLLAGGAVIAYKLVRR